MEKEKKDRGQWASSLGFIMATAGSAIGLGNLWKFPYLAGQNGGGAFVIVYILIVIFVGFTIMLGEITLGRATGLNALGAYRKLNKKFAWVGGAGILAAFTILGYYNAVGGWVIKYIVQFVTGGVSGDSAVFFGEFISSPIEPIIWALVFALATAFIVWKGISGGIEKYSKVLMPALFVLLIVVVIRSVTLPGAGAGLEYYLKPDFSKLTPAAIVAALGQVFFSLSLGMGCMITYGSYLSKDENIEKDAFIVPLMDTSAALLAGFAILPAVFAFGFEPGVGPSLMFITLPSVFAAMPLGAVFGLLFFILVLFAAITSSISLLEVCTAYFIDEFKWSRTKATLVLSCAIFVLTILSSLAMGPMANVLIFGKNFFDLLDFIASNILLPVGGLMMCIFIGYFWGIDNAVAEISQNGKFAFRLKGFWTVLVKYIAPIAVGIVFLNMLGIIKF